MFRSLPDSCNSLFKSLRELAVARQEKLPGASPQIEAHPSTLIDVIDPLSQAKRLDRDERVKKWNETYQGTCVQEGSRGDVTGESLGRVDKVALRVGDGWLLRRGEGGGDGGKAKQEGDEHRLVVGTRGVGKSGGRGEGGGGGRGGRIRFRSRVGEGNGEKGDEGWGGDGEGSFGELTPEGLGLPKLFSYALVLGKVGNPSNSLPSDRLREFAQCRIRKKGS